MFKKALLALAFLASAMGAFLPGPAFAQTADQAITGFLLAQGSTYNGYTCPSTQTHPCFVQYGSTLPVSGSFSATLSGFTPTAGATATLSASGTSADVALPAGTDVVVSSPSTNTVPVFIRLQAGAGTAVTSDLPVNPGAAVGFHITTATHISGITAGTAATLQIQGGSGLATGYGGGGSGGGGGGTSVAQGSTTAGQNVSPMGCRTLTSAPTDTTAQTNMPWCTTKGSQVVAQPTAADLNATVTGTVAATQSGTWNVTNVSGTVSLPTGAATSALQPTNAAQGSTTSGQTGPLVQCSVTTAAPTYTTAQTDPLNCTTNGAVRVLDNNSASLLAAAQAGTGSTGSAVPASAIYSGANSGGNLTGLIQADTSTPINISTATTTQLVALVSGKKIYVTAWDVVAAGTGNITLEYGTGSNCGTGTTVLTGAYNLTAQSGIAKGNGLGPVLVVPASNALCALTSAAVQMSGSVAYTQF